MKFILSNHKGFTLIEVLISLLLTVVLITAIVSLLTTMLQVWQVHSRKVEIQQAARHITEYMTYELRYAKSIRVSDDKSSVVFRKYAANNQEDTIRIYRSSDKIIRRENQTAGGGAQPLNDGKYMEASHFEIRMIDHRTIEIQLTMTDKYTDNVPRQSIPTSTKIVSMNIPPG